MSKVLPLLKGLHSPDVDDLVGFTPEDGNCFGFLLQAMFGPENVNGAESFDMMVCTPGWLAQEVVQKSIVIGRHHLIVAEYNFEQITSFLAAYGRRCEGRTWQDAALKLSRIGHWEFEDYMP